MLECLADEIINFFKIDPGLQKPEFLEGKFIKKTTEITIGSHEKRIALPLKFLNNYK